MQRVTDNVIDKEISVAMLTAMYFPGKSEQIQPRNTDFFTGSAQVFGRALIYIGRCNACNFIDRRVMREVA